VARVLAVAVALCSLPLGSAFVRDVTTKSSKTPPAVATGNADSKTLWRRSRAPIASTEDRENLAKMSVAFTAEKSKLANNAVRLATNELLSRQIVSGNTTQENTMDKDRIVGAAHQVKGAVKETVGKLTGDAKTQAEGAAEKAAGKVQNIVGGAKDAVRETVKK
jgi:uncharacterized protein YjbJ (UPF0337 family)